MALKIENRRRAEGNEGLLEQVAGWAGDVRLDARRVELRPESHNEAHRPLTLDLAKHILNIDSVAVRALIGRIEAPVAA